MTTTPPTGHQPAPTPPDVRTGSASAVLAAVAQLLGTALHDADRRQALAAHARHADWLLRWWVPAWLRLPADPALTALTDRLAGQPPVGTGRYHAAPVLAGHVRAAAGHARRLAGPTQPPTHRDPATTATAHGVRDAWFADPLGDLATYLARRTPRELATATELHEATHAAYDAASAAARHPTQAAAARAAREAADDAGRDAPHIAAAESWLAARASARDLFDPVTATLTTAALDLYGQMARVERR